MDEELTLLLILHTFAALCFLLYILISLYGSKSKVIPPSSRALIVIAHPDDEVMFFGPTIANLTRDHEMNVHLLVLSRGNFRGEGNLRKMELYKAAEALSISKDNITLLNYTKLQDNPKARWSEELVADIIYQYVESQDIGVILSFDRFGVSGHKNHSSIYNALLLLTSEERSQSFRSNNTRILVLNSVNILRKYSGVFDLPMSYALSPISFIASPKDWINIQKAMMCYGSQYVWFRKIYMIFSRYILINTYDILK
uniref:N-acetylglucosaminylphosphatidylinositol deacetylase n=1 Tax=Lepeophtheirus salmonis TaxID=72036 RepID=C1BSZ6_LEPSM|nr:N-acetylglucosaminyl-phosphatidylinositol de-N-acetylase [Lepeophtheirus salmonis]